MANNKEVLFGILGLGRVVDIRLSKLFKYELKNAKVNCVYDVDNKKNKKFQEYFNCKISNNLNDFFKVKNDYVYIATESGNHFKHIIMCLKNNKNVIVEKPPVLKIDQLIYLDKLARNKKLKLYTIFQNRFNKSVQYLKKILKNKNEIIFADLSLIWSRKQSYYSDWHGNWKLDGGVLAQQGIHYIDLLNYLLGKPTKCISTISNKINKLQAEDTHTAIVEYRNKISCTINMSTAFRPKDFEASIKIYSKNKVYILNGLCCNKVEIIDLNNNKPKLIKGHSENVPNGYGISHRYVLQNIVNNELRKKTKYGKPLKAIEALDTIRLLNMMYMSHEKNRWVNTVEKKIYSKLGN